MPDTSRLAPLGRLGQWFASLPRWVRGAIGVAAIVLGLVLLIRPTTSLGVLALLIGAGLILSGVLELVGHARPAEGQAQRRVSGWPVVFAVLWIVAGLFVLLWPGLTVRLVAVVVGVALIVDGARSVVAGLRRGPTLDARVAALALGIAEAVFGVLALAWPDITLLIVAVVFGLRLIIAGAGAVLDAFHGGGATEASAPPTPSPPGMVRRWVRTIASLCAVLLAIAALSVSTALRAGSPVVDEFYAPPRDVPAEPGRLIRAEPFTRAIPDDAEAWRILYTTSRGDGSPAVASGLVVVPREGEGSWPVIDWTHGTTGFAQDCAPSLAEEPFESGALFLLDQVIDEGWALVATDYIGLGTEGPHPYLIGPDSAHAALDAARAARQLPEAGLGPQTVVWGHSQGGGAALWTGALADAYAGELPIAGVAALAPASNLTGLVGNLPGVTGGSVFAAFVMAAYDAVYDDVTWREYVRPGAETTVREMSRRCLAPPGVLVSVPTALAISADPEIMATDPTTGALGARLAENHPPATISAPLLLGQGAADSLVIPAAQDAYVEALCEAGQQVDYRLYTGRDHVPLVEPDSPLVPELLAWTRDRLVGLPVEGGCTRREV